VAENRRLHRFIIEGVPVQVRRHEGTITGDQVRLIDFDDPDANDWLAVNQYTVIENKAKRRPDVVIFVNGIPLGVIELKNPGDENVTLDGAFNQLQTYKSQITSLFRTNAALVISDGIAARIGSLTADRERFMPWRTITGDSVVSKGTPELETVLNGVFDRRHFLDLMKDFIVFGEQKVMSSKSSLATTSSTPCGRQWSALCLRPPRVETAGQASSGTRKAPARAC
jgi:type I restriction enzyme, R subunit